MKKNKLINNFIITENKTIKEALRMMNKNMQGICLLFQKN